jgi:hypothetical protein
LFVIRTHRYYAVLCLAKNGVIKIFDGDKLVYADNGYWGRTTEGHNICSHTYLPGTAYQACHDEVGHWRVRVEGDFHFFEEGLPLVKHVVSFKVACQTVFRWNPLAEAFTRHMKKRRLMRHRRSPFTMVREFSLEPDRIAIKDQLISQAGHSIDRLCSTSMTAFQESPAAKVFVPYQLEYCASDPMPDALTQLNQRQRTRITTWIDLSSPRATVQRTME